MTVIRKALICAGTRPEVIKLLPVERVLRRRGKIQPITLALRQQGPLLDQSFASLEWTPDRFVDRPIEGFSLAEMLAGLVLAMSREIEREKPAFVITQGDTTTALASSLAAFYAKVPVAHVEAGLRTWNFEQPFPEEMHRACIDVFARHCFAPTEDSAANLLKAGVPKDRVFVTGNTVIDALLYVLEHLPPSRAYPVPAGKRRVVVTLHRRENFEKGVVAVCRAIRTLLARAPELDFLVTLHPNPNVKTQMTRELPDVAALTKIDPLPYRDFVHVLKSAWLVLTDSGGIQEEATALGVPFLVLREDTERPEGLRAGTGLLVGADEERVVAEVERLRADEVAYRTMATPRTVFGDGRSAERIADVLEAAE